MRRGQLPAGACGSAAPSNVLPRRFRGEPRGLSGPTLPGRSLLAVTKRVGDGLVPYHLAVHV
jgi:hypothetical protein